MKKRYRWRVSFQIGLSAIMVAACFLAACEEEPLRAPPVDRVEALFDPVEEIIPLPNDAAMRDGKLPGLPGAEAGTAAGELSDYLSGLSGWPRTSGIEIPFTGPLNEETINDESVRLYRFDDGQLERVEVAQLIHVEGEPATKIHVIPAQGLVAGEQYAVVATNALEDARGNSVGMALPIWFAASRTSLVDADGQPALDLIPDEETAVSLEGLRQLYGPVFEQIEEGVGGDDPVDRDDVVSMARWTMMPETAAAFHPDDAEVPLPNTVALDPDGTFPNSATCYMDMEEVGAEDRNNVIFDSYISSLSGWPDSAPITLPLTGPIDPESIGADDVQIWKNDGESWARIHNVHVSYREFAVDNCTAEQSEGYAIDITLLAPNSEGEMVPTSMDERAEYFAFATRHITDPQGEYELVPEAPLFLTMQPYPLVDDEGNSLVSILGDDDAQTLEGARQLVAPLIELVGDEYDLNHNDLAALWTWFTWNDTFAIFNPETGQIPFPHSALLGDDGTVNIPIPGGISSAQQGLLEALNKRTGFSQSAPGWVPLAGEIDEATLDHDSFLFAREGSVPVGEDALSLRYEHGMDRIVYETVDPLRAGANHIGAITPDLKGANGRPVKPTPIMVFLSMEDPLIVDGQSRVWALPDETEEDIETLEALEEARSAFSPAFLFFDLISGYKRHEFGAVWGMFIEDPIDILRQYRALAIHEFAQRADRTARRACEEDNSCMAPDDDPYMVEVGDEFEHPNHPGLMVDMSNVSVIQRGGEFDALAVDVETGTLAEGGESVGFSIFIPEEEQDGGQCEGPFDVVIAQHGLGGDRWQAGMGLANELASYPNCMATLAMDLPLHGGRALGAGSTHPESLPETSGAGFLSDDFLDSKNNFVQAMVDLFVLTRIIEGEDGESGLEGLFSDILGDLPIGGDDQLFTGRAAFAGISLGGIVGVPFTAVEPAVTSVALNGAGGRLTWLLLGDEDGPSTIGEPLLDELAAMGMEPGSSDFFEAMVFVQWLADAIDPFIFADLATSGGLPTLSYDADQDSFANTTGATCSDDSDCDGGWECETVSGQEVCVEYVTASDVLLQMSVGDRTVVNRATEALASELGVNLGPTTFEDVSHAFVADVDDTSPQFSAAQCAREQITAWLRSGLDGGATLPGALHADQCQ